jgi:hypothetical protein
MMPADAPPPVHRGRRQATMTEHDQRQLCGEHGVAFDPPDASSHVGIALHTLHLKPLHGMRIMPRGGVCGWYLWGGDLSEGANFFQPLCIEHLRERCPPALRFLGLPPGWRFLTNGEHSDVWYDEALRREV